VPGAQCRRLDLNLPDVAERGLHWQRALGGREPDAELLDLRLPRGTLHRVARRLAPDTADVLGAVIGAIADEGRHALEGIAQAVPVAAAEETLALPDDTQRDFDALLLRCRHRDRLSATLPAAFRSSGGVRALFKGPSGTGKTLAARHLAATLRRPLYRVDLAATVSKYIGETERNLERVFEAAESLDIVLLLDEGDALLAGRTGVSNATDRYANLETNYLLQRLEHYSGVLVVTTNAADRIDTAFARRMDVSIDFPLPDASTRLALWDAHLGPQHAVPDALLQRVALRCALAGGQIRNAALHAALLAIDKRRALDAGHLQAALEREYRKAGQRCPSFEAGD
jgi:SpoVK/Ycf46/Vps4 family AAA+-type ATPase